MSTLVNRPRLPHLPRIASRMLPSLPLWRAGDGDADPPPPFGVPPSEEGRSGDLGPPPPVFRDVGRGGGDPPPPPYQIESARTKDGNPNTFWIRVLIGFAILLVLFIVANIIVNLYIDRLWFDELGYRGVFNTRLGTRIWLFFAGFGIAAAFLLLNVAAAWRLPLAGPGAETSPFREVPLNAVKRAARIGIVVGALFIAIIFGALAWQEWELILQFIEAEKFGVTDPEFGRDVGFYVFKLEALQFIKGWGLGLAILGLFSGLAVYGFRFIVLGGNASATQAVRIHAAILLTLIIGLVVAGYWLSRFDLVLSQNGTVFGATFTDVKIRDTALVVMMGAGGIVALSILTWPLHQRIAVPGAALGFLVAASIGGLVIYPTIVQRFTVEPDELNRELDFIERNIDATRFAFGLDTVEENRFAANDQVTQADVQANPAALRNVRVWDHRPLVDTLGTIQQLREIYSFPDVDVDRYDIDGESQQVFLGVRELSQDRLPADQQGWVNRRLQFTHGFGLTVSPVDIVTESGEPDFFVSNIPPTVTNVNDPATSPLQVTQPRVYFGEETNNWVIVNSTSDEFDFPRSEGAVGEEGIDLGSQARNRYDGAGGVEIGGFFKRLAFAWSFADTNILISGSVSSDSRILFRRGLQDRIAELAPFLALDNDPYIVIGEDGGLFWIQDAYTTTDHFPYAQPHASGVNYIRNSVKVVVDAYNGDVNFYIVDASDPIIRVWAKIFPALFQDEAAFPSDLRVHWRYPEDLFLIQAEQYLAYHVVNPTELFNRSDQWAIPLEIAEADQLQPMEPYYVNIALQGAAEPEFLLIMPFTARDRPNAIGWLAGRSDDPNYGDLFAFNLGRGREVDGPQTVEGKIGNDSEVRTQINLLEDEGSGVIRGNLLAIPVGDAFLWVEPIFVQSSGSAFPLLQFVVVVNGDKVGFARSLEEAATEALGFPAGTGTALAPADADEPAQPSDAEQAQAQQEPADEEPDEQAQQPAADPGDLRALLDAVNDALADSRGQVDTLEALRDALEALLSQSTE